MAIPHRNRCPGALLLANVHSATYQQWVTTKFTPAEIDAGMAEKSADPDRDGLDNHQEYAFQRDPKASNPNDILSVDKQSGNLAVSFLGRPNQPGIFYEVQLSLDLLSWFEAAPDYMDQLPSEIINPDTVKRTFQLQSFLAAEPRIFFRIALKDDTVDTDFDGLDDAWEQYYGFNIYSFDDNSDGHNDAAQNFDPDSLSNSEEALYGTNPFSGDTDNDQIADDLEIEYGTDPTVSDVGLDTDNDGISNVTEVSNQTDPNEKGTPTSVSVVLNTRIHRQTFTSGQWSAEVAEPWQRTYFRGDNPEGLSLMQPTPSVPASQRIRVEYYFSTDGTEQVPVRAAEQVEYPAGTFNYLMKDVTTWQTSSITQANDGNYFEAGRRVRILSNATQQVAPCSGHDFFERKFSQQRLLRPFLSISNEGDRATEFTSDISINPGLLAVPGGSATIATPQPYKWAVKGTNTGITQDYVRFGSNFRWMDLSLYPKTVVKVALHLVNWRKSSVELIELPVDLNSNDVQAELNRIFGKQTNIHFEVSAVQYHELKYDVGDPQSTVPEYKAITSGPNGVLDIIDGEAVSPEERLFLNLSSQSVDFNVFVIPSPLKWHQILNMTTIPDVYRHGHVAGYALRPKNMIFVSEYSYLFTSPNFITAIIAHELGHSRLNRGPGLNHPRHYSKPLKKYEFSASGYPLRFINEDKTRLMWPFVKSVATFQNQLIIKQECDILNGRTPSSN